MDVILSKSEIRGEAIIPPSKSVAHRKMICAALAGCTLTVSGGKDMEATSRCLSVMLPFIKQCVGLSDCNAQYESSDCGAIILDKHCIPVLNAGESGSTLRFLLPVACALGAEFIFEGEGRLKDRPLGGLVDTLTAHGAKIERTGEFQLPLRVGGKLNAGEYVIDGGVSSQYVTGLLFALPLLDGDSTIKISGELVSKNYVDITLGVLEEFGIKVQAVNDGYFIKGNQRYVMTDDPEVEGDWSSAGFMLALGVLAGEVRLKGLKAQSLQGDKVVVELLRGAGADIAQDGADFVAVKSKLKAIDFDAKNCPDAVPIMATVLSFANGVSHIHSVDRLRDKESDRLEAVREMLSAFGIKTAYERDVLSVFGGAHKPCVASSYNDHRMAMSAMVCALATDGESTVRSAECISKSYPSFVDDIVSLGANVKRI